jgi:hypothetical protein
MAAIEADLRQRRADDLGSDPDRFYVSAPASEVP